MGAISSPSTAPKSTSSSKENLAICTRGRYAVRAPLQCEHAGDLVDPAFARAVRRVAGDADLSGLRADVDDAPVARGHHPLSRGLAGEEEATQVDLHELVPLVLGDVDRVVV